MQGGSIEPPFRTELKSVKGCQDSISKLIRQCWESSEVESDPIILHS